MDIETEVYYKDKNDEIIGANVLIYNDTEDIVEKVIIIEDRCFQNLKDKIDKLDTTYLTEEDLEKVLANTAEETIINATTLSNMTSADFAERNHEHGDIYSPKYHASNKEIYGLSSTSQYGHCKTRNDLTAQRYVDGEALSSYQGQQLANRITAVEAMASKLSEAYIKNSMRIKIGRWSDNAGEDGTKIELNYKEDGAYAKIYCDKTDYNYQGKDVIMVLNGVPYTRQTDSNGKTSRLAINLERGTYILTAFIRGSDGLNPASEDKIIIVK